MRVSNRGINYFYTTNENVVFEQGYTTTFNIEITQQGIIVTSDVVGEWNDGGTITGGIGERPPPNTRSQRD